MWNDVSFMERRSQTDICRCAPLECWCPVCSAVPMNINQHVMAFKSRPALFCAAKHFWHGNDVAPSSSSIYRGQNEVQSVSSIGWLCQLMNEGEKSVIFQCFETALTERSSGVYSRTNSARRLHYVTCLVTRMKICFLNAWFIHHSEGMFSTPNAINRKVMWGRFNFTSPVPAHLQQNQNNITSLDLEKSLSLITF